METAHTSLIKKPIGVYILTICLFLRFGVFQFISDFTLIKDEGSQIPLLIAFILIGRNVFVGGSAVWAFCGENWGRISLLAIVSLNVIWTVFNVITFVSFNNNEQNALILQSLFNPVFWLVVCWWYLNRKNVVEYYKQNDSN